MSTLIHLLRHADHGHVGKVLTGRAPGIKLSGTGRAQAERLARHMATMRLDALVTSPQLRAWETAAFISSATGLEIEVSPSLDEIDFGSWSGQTFQDLERDAQWRRWNADRDRTCTPARETMSDVVTRLIGFIDHLRKEFSGGSVCLVSHADIIKAGVCHYLGKSFQEIHAFEISPASVTTLLVDIRGGTVMELNKRVTEPEEVAR